MPEPVPDKFGPLQPLFGAVVCYALFYIGVWILAILINILCGQMMADTVSILVAATAANALSMATFESRGLSDLGLLWNRDSVQNLIRGMGVGIGSAILVVLPPLIMGMAHYRSLPHADTSLLAGLFLPVLLFCGAMGEEIAFRGFVLQYLVRGWRPWVAIVCVGALFGWMHNLNAGATLLSGLNTACFGILFGFAVLRSHSLWLPIGMHFGWNLALPFLGVNMSGFTIRVTGYELVWTTGDLWSGGSYGPEASVLTSAILAVLFLAVWIVPVRKGHAWLLDEPPAAL